MDRSFQVKDCSLVEMATGIKAQTLAEFRDRLSMIPIDCIDFHFWGARIRRTSFEHREYHNDFSYWAHHSLHDDILAERLELLNPTDYKDLEPLRADLIEIVENRLDESNMILWAKSEELFYFCLSKTFVFQTNYVINKPQELMDVLPRLTKSSIFYHFIDSTRRTPEKIDDLSLWLHQFKGCEELIAAFRKIDPYPISLANLQAKLVDVTIAYFLKNTEAKGENDSSVI